MITINLLHPELIYESSLPVSQYIIVNMTKKGSLLCYICDPHVEDRPTTDCIHIRRVPITHISKRLLR